MELVKEFDENMISNSIREAGDVDLGFMVYKVAFSDNGKPVNNNWENPIFSDQADTQYYRPHMIDGVIDVRKYREVLKC